MAATCVNAVATASIAPLRHRKSALAHPDPPALLGLNRTSEASKVEGEIAAGELDGRPQSHL